jgi:hypothetical protein
MLVAVASQVSEEFILSASPAAFNENKNWKTLSLSLNLIRVYVIQETLNFYNLYDSFYITSIRVSGQIKYVSQHAKFPLNTTTI